MKVTRWNVPVGGENKAVVPAESYDALLLLARRLRQTVYELSVNGDEEILNESAWLEE